MVGIRIFLMMVIAGSLYAADNRSIAQLEDIRTHFDTHIVKASNHHERAVVFDKAVKNIEKLENLDEGLKTETFKHFINIITKIEEETLDVIVLSAVKIADSIKYVEPIEELKHNLLAQVDDLQNASRAARNSAKEYITKLFDDKKKALASGMGAGPIVAPKKYHAHEHVVSVHAQQDHLNQLEVQFYTDIYQKKLSSQHMQHKLDDFITKIDALSGVSQADKEKAIKNITQAAQARLQEQGEKLPSRGAPAKKKRALKGRVVSTEEETKGHRYAESHKTASKAESKKESVTQEAARLRRERAAAKGE